MGWTIDFDLSTVLIFVAIYLCIVVFLRMSKRKSFAYLIFFTIFYIYIVNVLKFTQFPIYLSNSMRENVGQHVWENMNLVPLVTLGYTSIKTSLLNILLTIPFGFGLPFISKFRIKEVVLSGLIFGLMLEILQLLTALTARFSFRVVDINDVIFNVIGATFGYIVFVGFIRVVRHALAKWHIEQNVLLKYVCERPQTPKGRHSNDSDVHEVNI